MLLVAEQPKKFQIFLHLKTIDNSSISLTDVICGRNSGAHALEAAVMSVTHTPDERSLINAVTSFYIHLVSEGSPHRMTVDGTV